jgi:hypothetical protein
VDKDFVSGCESGGQSNLTINAPLIWKMRDIIFFFAGRLHNGPFQGIFRGGQDFFDP